MSLSPLAGKGRVVGLEAPVAWRVVVQSMPNLSVLVKEVSISLASIRTWGVGWSNWGMMSSILFMVERVSVITMELERASISKEPSGVRTLLKVSFILAASALFSLKSLVCFCSFSASSWEVTFITAPFLV